MTPAFRQALQDLREPPTEHSTDWEMLDDVMTGAEELNISHAGGEFSAAAELQDDLWSHVSCRPQRTEHRTRRDRTERRTELFDNQMEDLVDAYMAWQVKRDMPEGEGDRDMPEVVGQHDVRVVRVFGKWLVGNQEILETHQPVDEENTTVGLLSTDMFVTAAFVRNGLMPSAPLKPSVAIDIQALELYRISHLRCPRISIQSFVRTICDLHSVRFFSFLDFVTSSTFAPRFPSIDTCLVSSPSHLICTLPFDGLSVTVCRKLWGVTP
jgi:hypothetical protein